MPATGLSSADPSAEAGILLSVLRAASSGNDVSHMVPELLKAVLSKPATNPHVRKLAYEVCRHANLTESEYSRLWERIAIDVSDNNPEVVATAVRFLTCMPAAQLADRLVIGQLAELLKPCLAAEVAVVRASAVQTLSYVLLLQEVQQAAAGSAGLANAYEGLWDEVADSLLDERPFVVGQAAAAIAQLLACGIDGGASGFSGLSYVATARSGGAAGESGSLSAFMMSRLADRAALRLSAALGPVLETCGLVPAPGQVAVCDMLLALTRRLLAHTVRSAAGSTPPVPPASVPALGLASLVTSVATYLATQLQAGDVAARTEACGCVLELAADLAEAGPVAGAAAAGLPQSLILGAVDALTQLRERQFVEAGLGDMCEALAGALPALQPAARVDVLRKLWPLAGCIDDVSRRARVFSIAWRAAVSSEMDFRTSSRAGAGGPTGLGQSPLAAPAAAPPPSSTGSGPLGLLVGRPSQPAADGTGAESAAGVVTVVPPSCRVVALLKEPYVGAILSGKAPAAEAIGAFAAAQATAVAIPSPGGSLLSSLPSMSRVPPPPPMLTLPRSMDSMRSSNAGTPVDSARSLKPEKDTKGSIRSRFFRSMTKARPERPYGDHGSPAASPAAAAAKEAAAAAAAAKQDEAAATAAAASAAAAAASAASVASSAALPPRTPMSPGGDDGSMLFSPVSAQGSTADVAAALLARPPPSFATLRHELLQCLLQQLAHHPAAAVAAELCAEHAAAARHDRHPPTHSAAAAGGGASASLAQRLSESAQWVVMASEVLADSAACVSWEPYVMPAITANPSVPHTSSVPVDFNNLTADLWLGVMQAALQAARSIQAFLGRMVAEAVDAAEKEAAAGQLAGGPPYTGLGYGIPYGMAAGGLAAAQADQQQQVTAETHYRALLSYVKERADMLQWLLLKLLSNWASLSASVRPRVAWVAAHSLALSGHWDDRWELLLGCLDALLVRGTDTLAASRRHDLLGSALAGGLFKAGRQAWTDPSRPFLFDIASASALCEAPEYEVLGLLVALSALQHLAALLVNSIADAVPHGAAGAAHGQAAAVAKRMEAVMRHFIGTELASAPHVRDWCKRVLRFLATIMTYNPPIHLPVTVAALGVIAKQAHGADGGEDNAAADDDSSDASSAYHPDEAQQELPPSLAAAVAAATAGQAQAKPQAQTAAAAAAVAAAAAAPAAANGTVANGEAAPPDGTRAPDDAAKQRAAPGNSYLVHSASASVPMWGYPFAPLSAIALQNSKRARRHRALSQHLASAAVAAEAPRPVLAVALRPLRAPEEDATAASASPASGPTLSSRTQYRLDNESFWSTVQNTHSPWQELTGPSDPLLLRGCFVRPDPTRGDSSTITIMLSAVNRLPVDLSDVDVALKTNGPLLSSSRRAATWELPRMAAHDRAVASFTFKVLGYGDLQLHPRLQLCPGPARTDSTPLQLNCLPLEVPTVILMRLPRLLPEPAEFFKNWGALPARTELSGACTWPGPEGGALLLSALLRQPLGCVWLQYVPAVYGFQAAFVADMAPGDVLVLVVVTQLMPAAAPGGNAETFCTFSIRSSSPDLTLSLQNGAAAWLTQISSGTASLGGAGRTAQPAPSAKPPLHPRVAALLQSYTASAAQLDVLTPMRSFGLTSAAGGGMDLSAVGHNGPNTVMLKNAALLEWQRLSSLAL